MLTLFSLKAPYSRLVVNPGAANLRGTLYYA